MKIKLLSTISLTLVFLYKGIFPGNVFAQAAYYSFSQYTSTYANLTSPISINNGNVWNYSGSTPDPYIGINITSFLPNFKLFGVGAYGPMRIYGGVIRFYDPGLDYLYYVNGYGLPSPDGMKDKGTTTSLSPISYQVTGTSPNKILKIEWQNAGHAASTNDFINMQIWLYQTSNTVEVHYGPSSITNVGSTQTSVGIGSISVASNFVLEEDFLINDPSNPVLSLNANAFFGIPANGTVYKFAVGGTGINELNNPLSAISVFPNPTQGKITINMKDVKANLNNVKMIVTNLLGETGYEISLDGQTSVDIDFFDKPRGIYFVKIYNEETFYIEKIVIQ